MFLYYENCLKVDQNIQGMMSTRQKWYVSIEQDGVWKEENMIEAVASTDLDYQNPLHILHLEHQADHSVTEIHYSKKFATKMVHYHNSIIEAVYNIHSFHDDGEEFPYYVQMHRSNTLLLSIIPHIVPKTLERLTFDRQIPNGLVRQGTLEEKKIPLIPNTMLGEAVSGHVLERIVLDDDDDRHANMSNTFMLRLCHEFSRTEIIDCNPNCLVRLVNFVISCMMKEQDCISHHTIHVHYHLDKIPTFQSVGFHLHHILHSEWLNKKDLFLFIDHTQGRLTSNPAHMQYHLSLIHLSADRKVATMRCALRRTWDNDNLYQAFHTIIMQYQPFTPGYTPSDDPIQFVVAMESHYATLPFCLTNYCVNESVQFLIVRLTRHPKVRDIYKQNVEDKCLLSVTHGLYILFYNFLIDLRDGMARETLDKQFHFEFEPTVQNVFSLLRYLKSESQKEAWKTLFSGTQRYFEEDPRYMYVNTINLLNSLPLVQGKREYLSLLLKQHHEHYQRNVHPKTDNRLLPTFLCVSSSVRSIPIRPNELTVHAMITGMFYALLIAKEKMELVHT